MYSVLAGRGGSKLGDPETAETKMGHKLAASFRRLRTMLQLLNWSEKVSLELLAIIEFLSRYHQPRFIVMFHITLLIYLQP